MKNQTKKLVPAVILCIVCIMLLSVFPRLVFHFQNMTLGSDFIDSETGLPYLCDKDCYYHLRMTRDIALYGHPGDTVKDGFFWDSFSYAPEGRNTSTYRPLLAYFALAADRVISVFTSQSLEQTVYWLNVFLSALLVIPVFLLTFKMCGLTGAIAASVLSVLNIAYLNNTMPGFYDTDCVINWVACFFFLFAVKLVEGWEERDKKSLFLYGIGVIVSFTALYNGWYVYYLFPGIFTGALILYMLFTWRSEEKKTLYSIAPLLFVAGIIILIFLLEPEFISSIKKYINRLFVSEENSSGRLFGNVFSSINELQKVPLFGESLSDVFRLNLFSEADTSIINLAGGIIPFLSACAMCVILTIRIIRKNVRVEYLLLLIWFAVTLVLSFIGRRFIILFAVPSAILAGNLVGSVCSYMDQRELSFRNVYKCLILVPILLPVLCGVYGMYSFFCSITDEDAPPDRQVEECLLRIRENTPEDTMLVSWWDFGYFLEEKGRRRAVFDGGSQNWERTYLISRAFATENEELSANIFRMLSGSGNKGCDLLLSTFGKTEETLYFLDELLSGSKDKALEKLADKSISGDLSREITGLLFPENLPLTECIITPDMPWYCGWFPIFGRTTTEKKEKPVDFTGGVKMMPIDIAESGRTAIDSENGYYVILEKDENGWLASTSNTEEPSGEQPCFIERVITLDHGVYREYPQNNDLSGKDPVPFTVIVTINEQETTLSMVTSSLADSVFGRMVYLGGEGLTRYEAEPGFSNDTLVYRIGE